MQDGAPPERRDAALPAKRRAGLVKQVRDRGHVTVTELADEFDVSLDTIRRDLDLLAQQRLVARTRGGAMRTDELATADTPFEKRTDVHRAAKEAIGAVAAGLVSDGETILVNGGTTTLAVARSLAGRRDLTVVTNNLRLPSELPPAAVRDLYILGGICRIESMVTIGPLGFPGTRGVSADVAVIGVGGVSADNGLSTTNLAEAQMIQEMIRSAARTVVVVDSSKFGRNAFVHICDLAEIATLVTDAPPDPALAEALAAAGVALVPAS
jgi:DeoR/GlpR family transcriptional regulator of sugar metabolism